MTDLNHLIVIYLTKEKKELVSEAKLLSLIESQKIECEIIQTPLLKSEFLLTVIVADKEPSLSQLNLSDNEFLSFEDSEKKVINPLCHLGEELDYPFYYLIKNEPVLKTLKTLSKILKEKNVNIIDIKLVEDIKTPCFAFFQSSTELKLDTDSIIKRVEKDIQITK